MARRGMSGRMVAVDVLDRAIRAVEVNWTAGRMEVTGLAAGTLPGPVGEMSPADAGRVLGQVLREGRIGARQALITIPRHLAVLKPLTVPPMERQELLPAILLQAERELPFPVTEAHLDCVPTSTRVAAETESAEEGTAGVGVLLGAVQRSVLETCVGLLEGAGLSPRRMGLRPCATANALVFAGADTAGQFVALVDIGETVTEISIVRDRHLVFSRSVTIGASPEVKAPAVEDEVPVAEAGSAEEAAEGQDLSLFRQWQEALVVELRRTLEAFAVQPGGGAISALYLTGIGAGDEPLAAAIAEALTTRVAILDPFEGLDLRGRVRGQKGERLTSFATALGTAVSECQDLVPAFDFLAPLEDRLRKAPRRRPLVAVGLGVAVLALAIAVPAWLFSARRAELDRLDGNIEQVNKDAQIAKDISEKIDDLAPWTDPAQRVSWYRVFLSLSSDEVWPKERAAYITSLGLQSGNRVAIGGRAQNPAVFEAVLKKLHEAKEFGVPKFASQRVVADKLGYPIQFSITVEWLGAAAAGSPTTTRRAS